MTTAPQPAPALLDGARTQHGESVRTLSDRQPLLVVFLRHFGWPFCREALGDLAARRAEIEAAGAAIVLVHMASDAEAAEHLPRYGLADVARVSDPGRRLYAAFGLGGVSLAQLVSPRVVARAGEAWLAGHRMGRPQGATGQMPGVFVVHRGTVVTSFRHETMADRPDYVALVGGG